MAVVIVTLSFSAIVANAQQPPKTCRIKVWMSYQISRLHLFQEKNRNSFKPRRRFMLSRRKIFAARVFQVFRNYYSTVPGLSVAQMSGNTWAVSSRGFNSQFANKMLVLVDGRSVYSPDFSGVYWDAQDLILEDIERIEVIRGPGATIWGSNAVNGVINIITKRAGSTQGRSGHGQRWKPGIWERCDPVWWKNWDPTPIIPASIVNTSIEQVLKIPRAIKQTTHGIHSTADFDWIGNPIIGITLRSRAMCTRII